MTDPIHSSGSTSPATYPSDLGDFNVLSNETIARILSRNQPLVPGSSTPLVCDRFQQIFQDPVAAYLYLENELKEKTVLSFTEINSYRIQFREKYQRELSLSTLFAKCPQLTT